MKETFQAVELTPIRAQVTKIERAAADLIIAKDEDMNNAADVLSKIKAVAKQIDEKKKSVTDPLNVALKAARGLFAPLETAWANAEATVKQKMVQFRAIAEKKRLEEEARIIARMEKGTIKEETAIRKLEALPMVGKTVEGNKGSVTFRKVKKFDELNINMAILPPAYHLPNLTLIRKEMWAGIELPGVRYFEEEQPAGR